MTWAAVHYTPIALTRQEVSTVSVIQVIMETDSSVMVHLHLLAFLYIFGLNKTGCGSRGSAIKWPP